jgi:hypothetical protein
MGNFDACTGEEVEHVHSLFSLRVSEVVLYGGKLAQSLCLRYVSPGPLCETLSGRECLGYEGYMQIWGGLNQCVW